MKLVRELQILWQFLVLGKSTRKIEVSVFNMPYRANGGGFRVYQILKDYGLGNKHKGILNPFN